MRISRVAMALMLGLAVAISLTPQAQATGGVVDRETVQQSFDEVEGGLSEACETEVRVSGSLSFDVRTFADGSVKDHHREDATFSSEYGSISLRIRSMIHFEPEHFVDNGDGTTTIIIPHTENLMVRLQSTGEPPSTMDVGKVSWWLEVTIDSDTGELVSIDEEILSLSGQFDFISGDADFVETVCRAVGP